MKLPSDFSFSPSMLQNYLDCEYRFLLFNIRGLDWPAVESEPMLLNQEKIRQGLTFHRLVQQFFAGIDPDILSASILDPKMLTWWENFRKLNLENAPGSCSAEQLLSVPFAGYRLSAKYDLVIQQASGEITIYDWKTSLVIPNASLVRERAQSRVYPLIQYRLQSKLPSTSLEPKPDIRMIYWYPEFPENTIVIDYDQQQYLQDEGMLTNLITEIVNKPEEEFNKTADLRKCAFCKYRSLCARGTVAGDLTTGFTEVFEEDIFGIAVD